ncbi:hypothetical protein Sme01_05240 [Sphaerisporangium melleum]|uniref:Uncharacterized protein n=1 Tax=Sphaerisporangium melleum TaxID=321316 RepID=A0A917QPZ8_9ACTN|nr:hypothetical protein [Sphaerisporangium melleum]GGK63115.1 hypothetical protein GCM10007964_02810 [Sphaerisporangium melleum]GII68048.1 hypothetical protein Sme01_05240 [Sphaerisporangium melleum]
MSEYQHYEFVALDRPLSQAEQAEVRSLSSRAEITATAFTGTYEDGDFRGDPAWMMERFYDAHVHLTGSGIDRLMLRLPTSLLDASTVDPYLCADKVEAWEAKDHLVLDLFDDEEPGDAGPAPEEVLPALVGVRAELASGDLRPLYLAWLAAIGTWERDEDAFDEDFEDEAEPPVPAGLGSLTAAQRALAGFLRLDADLLATAAANSPDRPTVSTDPERLARWVAELGEQERDALLVRVAQGEAGQVHLELLRRFRTETGAGAEAGGTGDAAPRTVAELLDAAAARRQ